MLSIKSSRKAYFTFDIDGTTYAAPIAGELPMEWMDRLVEAQNQPTEEARGYAHWRFLVDFFRAYAGADTINQLTTEEFNALAGAWDSFTEESEGATPGE